MRGAAALTAIGARSDNLGLGFRHDPASGFGAVFSPCGAYRYLLWRLPSARANVLGMGMLNPSTADERADDPTISRCRRIAVQAGHANLLVWNLFAFRATAPADLKLAADPVGPHNDAAMALALGLSRRTILAWGNHASHLGRGELVLPRCLAGMRLASLGFTKLGQPRHPLYLSGQVKPCRWPGPKLLRPVRPDPIDRELGNGIADLPVTRHSRRKQPVLEHNAGQHSSERHPHH